MRKPFFFLISLFHLCNVFKIYSQDVPINDLKSPTSPVFSLMGIAPVEAISIETPKAFGLAIINLLNKAEAIPKNVSMEGVPYWLIPSIDKSHLSFKKYYEPSFGQCLIQNLAISIASSPLDTPLTGTSIGVGLRTILFPGQPTDTFNYIYKLIKEKQTFKGIFTSIIGPVSGFVRDPTDPQGMKLQSKIVNKDSLKLVIKEYYETNKNEKYVKEVCDFIIKKIDENSQTDMQELVNKIHDDFDNSFDVDVSKQVEKLTEQDKKRVGLKILLSGAYFGNFPKDSIQLAKSAAIGGWFTLEYSWTGIDILALTRYIHDYLAANNKNMGDLGARLKFKIDKLGFSFEGLTRMSNENKPNYRYAFNADYEIIKNSFVTATFGKNFEGNSISLKGNVIALLGINFGFGKDPVVSMK
jgi:hypothetical protein